MRALVPLLALALLAPSALGTQQLAEEGPGARVASALGALGVAAGIPEADVEPGACSLEEGLGALAAYAGHRAPLALPPLDARAEASLAALACAVVAANAARDAAYVDADWDAIARSALSGGEGGDIALTPAHTAANLAGALAITRAVDVAVAELAPVALPPSPALAPPQHAVPGAFAFDLVGVDTLYDADYALVVDVGGNDVYANNAGGSLIALGDGGLLPIHGDPESFGPSIEPIRDGPRVVVGGDFEDAELLFSASVLLDLEGDDTYGVKQAPWHDAQCTSEPVVRKVVIQGSGAGGPGLLFDLAGNDHFLAKTVAQGTGHAGGIGALYLGPGDATLEAVRLAQGSGLFFGIGLLLDEGGDDRYLARVPAGGVFNTDGSFCDDEPRYLHGTGFARVTGGASGVAGALIDRAGNDAYEAGSKSQGLAEVASVGLLLDEQGDDTYVATTRAMGFAAGHPSTFGGGLALHLDLAGNDAYRLRDGFGLGATPGALADPEDVPMPYSPPTFWVNDLVSTIVDPVLVSGAALFYDGGGTDAYDTPDPRANGQAGPTSVGGVFVDAT